MNPPLKNSSLFASLFIIILVASFSLFIRFSATASEQKNNFGSLTDKHSDNRNRIDMKVGNSIPSKAVGFAISEPVRRMKATKAGQANVRSLQALPASWNRSSSERGTLAYTNEEQANYTNGPEPSDVTNTEPGKVRNIDPAAVKSSPDRALSPVIIYPSPNALPTPSVSFEGISVFDTVPLGQGFLPPDTTGEAGPNHFVQAVNVAFQVWDKEGIPLTPAISLGTLFSALPGPCKSSLGGSPNVLYDQLADRWLITQRCNGVLPGHDVVAVSKSGDPTGAYFLYDFAVPNVRSVDSPKFGVWPDGYYMADMQFRDDSGLSFMFKGAGFFAFDRAKMLAGDPTAGLLFFDSCSEVLTPCTVIGAYPSDMDGFIPPPPGSPNVFALYTSDEFSDPQGDGLRLFDFHADFTNPGNSTFTERPESPVSVAAFDPLVSFIHQPNHNFSSQLDHQAGRLMYRLAYRNFGSGLETLVATHTVDTPTEDHAGVRYYQLNRTSPGGPFTVAEQQTFSPDTDSRWMGSAAMNFQGDTAVGYSVSSDTVFP